MAALGRELDLDQATALIEDHRMCCCDTLSRHTLAGDSTSLATSTEGLRESTTARRASSLGRTASGALNPRACLFFDMRHERRVTGLACKREIA
eukprot:CAMPEP_0115827636 /NCGR_PEP_ID=MMETSP0287-20121206/149_1 /TAXON_ID=412157 /ORGANISM="Chrysochromulina rotalis, Strain UIO044" /LENGTH=93 /DNA_ID=CAMNT_0003280805 /DNA_START=399 /DNA_END=680 /DNA_ORIENTATION=+